MLELEVTYWVKSEDQNERDLIERCSPLERAQVCAFLIADCLEFVVVLFAHY